MGFKSHVVQTARTDHYNQLMQPNDREGNDILALAWHRVGSTSSAELARDVGGVTSLR